MTVIIDAPIYPKNTKHTLTFTVTGRGAFPVDMLRYDRCWPRLESEVGRITSTGDTRTVQMRSNDKVTPGRWASFGWTVHEVQSVLR